MGPITEKVNLTSTNTLSNDSCFLKLYFNNDLNA